MANAEAYRRARKLPRPPRPPLPPRVRLLFGIATGGLVMGIVGFAQWLRLQMQLGMDYQAAKAGVPYQNVNLRAADAVNRLSNVWLAAAVLGLLLSAGLLLLAVRLKAPDSQARAFWRG